MWQALPFCLLALVGFGLTKRDFYVVVTPAILLYDWCVCTGYVMLSGDAYPWPAFAAFDFIAALAVAMVMVSNWQRIIVASYAVELICHAAFGLSGHGYSAMLNSYYVLLYAAWTQVALCLGWLIHDYVHSWLHSDSSSISPPPRVEKSR